jgi:hypothetical protein
MTAYDKSFLAIKPAPEVATGEVLLAGLYRACGFPGLSEREVPMNRVELEESLNKARRTGTTKGLLSSDDLHTLLESLLRSPKRPNQSSAHFLQVTPIVPETTLYTSSARLRGNPWPAGKLVLEALSMVLPTKELEAQSARIFEALTVTGKDDIWAKFLEKELRSWRPGELASYAWTRNAKALDGLKKTTSFGPHGEVSARSPAAELSRDLDSVLKTKPLLTRRQWVSLLESIIRIGCAAHVFWMIRLHRECYDTLNSALGRAQEPPPLARWAGKLSSGNWSWIRYGAPITREVRKQVRDYILARETIEHLAELSRRDKLAGGLDSATSFLRLCSSISKLPPKRRERISSALNAHLETPQAAHLLTISGYGNNVYEFLEYVLQQRQTADPKQRHYDQGYWSRKAGDSKYSRWVLSAGPVALMTLAYCAHASSSGVVTIAELCNKLATYGILLPSSHAQSAGLTASLQNLGLTTDSPDAEGGMLIINPFPGAQHDPTP